ncbi:pyrroloquinoline quinone biosynthesis protein PqqE [Pseudanabaenaceae cyanobacterium LEGE 13415]|nr:pyrroloquinoline quinone biosynthesis protein PqqE [Pseudanabaenaceae cyanobacterium LEGE 13415]
MNEIPRPFTLVAELTYRCPLRCPYCSNPLNWSEYQQELSTEDWMRVIRQARQLGVLQLGLTGGEPLLRNDLETLVETAAELGLYTTLVTAGTLFSPERATKLKQLGLDHVQISIQDSESQNNDRIAGTRSFDQKLAAARLAKALDFPLTLNFVLHRQNLDRIEEMLLLAEELNVDRVELANTQYYGWALHNRTALLPTREQLAYAEKVVKAAQQRGKIPMGILYVIPDYYAQYPKPCMGGWGNRTLIVTPTGEGLPCQSAMAIPGLEFGNVREHTLDWIWFESSGMNQFRGTDWMPEPCQSCDRKTLDWGGCRCQAFLLTQNAQATDPVCYLSPNHAQIQSVLDQLPEQMEPFVYRDRQAIYAEPV